MRKLLPLAALPLMGFAQAQPVVLPVDPAFYAEDTCLAPATGSAGCPSAETSVEQPTSSAALLPWDMPQPERRPEAEPQPLLAFDRSVLLEGTEVTFSGV